MRPPSIVALAHHFLRERVRAGDTVVDATAGRGHDTRFLADLVGSTGRVFAFDIQETALEETKARFPQAHEWERVTFFQRSHAELGAMLPGACEGTLAAVVFNLGYLPGGDHRVTTVWETTRPALRESLAWLRRGGLLLVVLYPGHPEGAREKEEIDRWLSSLPREEAEVYSLHSAQGNHRSPPPELRLLYRVNR